jgi:hypothetical protein
MINARETTKSQIMPKPWQKQLERSYPNLLDNCFDLMKQANNTRR